MSQVHWQPAASLAALQARARLNQQIREFFQQRQVLEVDTPLLCHATGTDPNLAPITATWNAYPGAVDAALYLQTSPEFAMKRLLASGSGPIYQLCKAFRNSELGTRHNPEFTMLEWYQPGYTLAQLMDEVEALVQAVLGPLNCKRLSYRELFQQYLGIDPHTTSTDALATLTAAHVELHGGEAGRDTWLELLYSQVIEPQLQEPVFIHEYPASQAALSRVLPDSQGRGVAQRFELVIKGMEIANGYDELVDAGEQKMRFTADQHRRRKQGLPIYEADPRLLAALAHGMPPSAGVALGVDRLLMLQTGAATIAEVLAFPHERA